MKCPKCNSSISDNSKYCIRCGAVFGDYSISEEDKFEQELIKAYVGDKLYEKDGNTSYICFFLNFIYLFYKKMYIEGIFCMISISILWFVFDYILMFLAALLLPTTFVIIVFVGVIIYYAKNFSMLYFNIARSDVNRIMIDNKDKSKKEIKELCRKKSKPNYFLTALSIVIFFGIYQTIHFLLTYIMFGQ